MSEPDVRVHPTRSDAASSVAEDVVALLAALLDADASPRVVLTGGSVAREVHRGIAARSQGLDWGRVTVLWGDERFVPAGDEERNDAQAEQDLLGAVPVDPALVLRVPSRDDVVDVQQAAAAYARTVARLTSSDDARAPAFDLLMLGVGPDGHVASLFPGRDVPPGLVVPVRDSPKPPPERVTMGYELLGRARRVWYVAAGEDKADAVRGAVTREPADLPAARVRGLEDTRFHLDEAAASRLG